MTEKLDKVPSYFRGRPLRCCLLSTIALIFVLLVYIAQYVYFGRQLILPGKHIELTDLILHKNATYPVAILPSIPKVIYQTYQYKDLIPPKVEANFQKFAPGYKRIVFNDTEAAKFIRHHFHPAVHETFHHMKGPHRADLFRYCILYVRGGYYFDIKVELMNPMDGIFPTSKLPTLYTTIGWERSTIFQGVIASPKHNPIFLKLIQQFVILTKPLRYYHTSTRFMYNLIAQQTGKTSLTEGLLLHNQSLPECRLHQTSPADDSSSVPPQGCTDYVLFQEERRPIEECYDGADKYGGCYWIYHNGTKIIKTRYADYPWHRMLEPEPKPKKIILLNLAKYFEVGYTR